MNKNGEPSTASSEKLYPMPPNIDSPTSSKRPAAVTARRALVAARSENLDIEDDEGVHGAQTTCPCRIYEPASGELVKGGACRGRGRNPCCMEATIDVGKIKSRTGTIPCVTRLPEDTYGLIPQTNRQELQRGVIFRRRYCSFPPTPDG